ncbi:hypothetical protein Dda_6953 [Drechslerella dactyloides]|uniref:Uncharacterized protein n=1 Tax=Drechslerella dactyloides TaxID=74499 RepID=A0AAD6NFX1_DREDA|nr:hypothetical protein Dda_6953 [Drechslerella dactyloides]
MLYHWLASSFYRHRPPLSVYIAHTNLQRAEKECRDELEATNVCATDTWNLYIQGENHPFCCTPDLVGYATELYKGYGKCVPPGTELEFGDSGLNVQEQGLRGSSTSTAGPSSLTSRTGTSIQTSRGDATTTSDPSAASGLNTISTGTAPTITVTGNRSRKDWMFSSMPLPLTFPFVLVDVQGCTDLF